MYFFLPYLHHTWRCKGKLGTWKTRQPIGSLPVWRHCNYIWWRHHLIAPFTVTSQNQVPRGAFTSTSPKEIAQESILVGCVTHICQTYVLRWPIDVSTGEGPCTVTPNEQICTGHGYQIWLVGEEVQGESSRQISEEGRRLGLYSEFRCVMGNGHMGTPPYSLWKKDRHLRKYYLLATSLTGGKNVLIGNTRFYFPSPLYDNTCFVCSRIHHAILSSLQFLVFPFGTLCLM